MYSYLPLPASAQVHPCRRIGRSLKIRKEWLPFGWCHLPWRRCRLNPDLYPDTCDLYFVCLTALGAPRPPRPSLGDQLPPREDAFSWSLRIEGLKTASRHPASATRDAVAAVRQSRRAADALGAAASVPVAFGLPLGGTMHAGWRCARKPAARVHMHILLPPPQPPAFPCAGFTIIVRCSLTHAISPSR